MNNGSAKIKDCCRQLCLAFNFTLPNFMCFSLFLHAIFVLAVLDYKLYTSCTVIFRTVIFHFWAYFQLSFVVLAKIFKLPIFSYLSFAVIFHHFSKKIRLRIFWSIFHSKVVFWNRHFVAFLFKKMIGMINSVQTHNLEKQ